MEERHPLLDAPSFSFSFCLFSVSLKHLQLQGVREKRDSLQVMGPARFSWHNHFFAVGGSKVSSGCLFSHLERKKSSHGSYASLTPQRWVIVSEGERGG